MKKIILSLLTLVPLLAGAQTFSGGELPPLEPTRQTVFDSARVKVYYEYAYRKNPDDTTKWKRGQVIMLVGDRYTGCADYFSVRFDSLINAYCREKRSSREFFGPGFAILKQRQYDYPLVIDNVKNKAHVQINGVIDCEYTQKLEPLDWTLAGGDSIISGVHCKKATCSMGGREWVAWYSEEYSMPYGPYLFRGLPGLIFAVSDTGRNYTFALNGLETPAVREPIYLKKDNKIMKLSREDALKAQRNAAADPIKAMNMSGMTVTLKEGTVVSKRKFNPIEIE